MATRCDQLYYPNLNPALSPRIAACLLHWDSVYRIFPLRNSLHCFSVPRHIERLEERQLFGRHELALHELSQASLLFERLVELSNGDKTRRDVRLAGELITPLHPTHVGRHCIYAGKTKTNLARHYPKLFSQGSDKDGNDVYWCSQRTGITFMAFLTYLTKSRGRFENLVTDWSACHEVFLLLAGLAEDKGSPTYLGSISTARLVDVERVVDDLYVLPVVRLLRPHLELNDLFVDKLLAFRSDDETNAIRRAYMARVEHLTARLHQCRNPEEIQTVATEEHVHLHKALKLLVAACKGYGIPVQMDWLVREKQSRWELVASCWRWSTAVVELFQGSALFLIDALLKLPPAIDAHQDVMAHGDYYPMLIQESFVPTRAQRIFAKMRRMNRVRISLSHRAGYEA